MSSEDENENENKNEKEKEKEKENENEKGNENKNENENENENENDKTLIIKQLNNDLYDKTNQIIDKSKSFEEQIESVRKVQI